MQDFRTETGWMPRLLGHGVRAFVVLAGLCMALPAQAHKASDAYLQLQQEGQLLSVRWEVALRDLQSLLPLDANDDGRITWGEFKARHTEIKGYMLSHLSVRSGAQALPCVLRPAQAKPVLERRAEGTYYALHMSGACPGRASSLQVSYRFMQEIDPTHRGLLVWKGASDAPVALVPDGRAVMLVRPPQALSMMDAPAQRWASSRVHTVSYTPDLAAPVASVVPVEPVQAHAWQLVRDGIHHILVGADHVLFLICLLLPAVLVRRAGAAGLSALEPVPHARAATMPVLGAVTMFTLAHSITLTLAGLGWVNLSPRIVEPAIALTIALAAIDNVWPIFQGRRHLFTFLFGLVHGFGFAGVLSALNLPPAGFVWALLQFNLGVELGQMLIVVPAMAVLLPLRHWQAYPRQFMPAASMVALTVAAGWWVERVFDLGFMPV
jgi:HupE / UreJ protein